MRFTKSFPLRTDKSAYPTWKEIILTEKEEQEAEEKCRIDNVNLMQECLKDAKKIVEKQRLHETQEVLAEMAVALFEKRASHAVFYKERMAKAKFDEKFDS